MRSKPARSSIPGRVRPDLAATPVALRQDVGPDPRLVDLSFGTLGAKKSFESMHEERGRPF